MPAKFPDQKLMTRKEVAAVLGVSYDTVADRMGGTECLMEIRQTKIVQFNPYQVEAHVEAVYIYGKCAGRCKSALEQKRTLQFKKSA